MKYIKKFETGELDQSESKELKKALKKSLKTIKNNLDDKSIFEINSIWTIDAYEGAKASVKIFNKSYHVSEIEKDVFFIEYFPIDNSEEGYIDGYSGDISDIIDLLNDIINTSGDVETYITANKYNL